MSASHYDGRVDEIVSGTMHVTISDAEIIEIAQRLGVDIDAIIATNGGLDEGDNDGN